jgi:hypothetical protein
MKNIILTLIAICSFSVSNAQSKKEIIQELTIENSNLKQEVSSLKDKNTSLNDKITLLNAEITSLKKELIVDKVQTPQEYGKTLFNLFVSQRLSKYPELQFQLKDTIFFDAEEVDNLKKEIIKTQKNDLEFYLEGINNGIDWSKVEYDKFEYEIEKPNGDISTNHLRGKFYFNYLGKKYNFRIGASILENGKWRGYIFNDLVNISEVLEIEEKEEQERLKQPYIPRGVKFGGVVFSYNSKVVNPKTMYGLTIPIENNTPYAIDWIKFQFRIYENDKLILSKNITIGDYSSGFDSKLEPSEKEIVQLNDIGEVFIGSGVKNDKWSYDVELLEVKPKPSED